MQEPAGVEVEREDVEARRDRAMDLQRLSGEWTPDQRLEIRRLVRDSRPEVWQAACEATGLRAGWDRHARQEVVDLLGSPSWELRLRGLSALRLLGEAESSEILPFLEQRLDEAAAVGDAALLDSVVMGMAHLEGEGLGPRLLEDPREVVRAAVAAHLEDASIEVLERAARDSSVRVRVALASTIGRFAELPTPIVGTLAADPDPVVRSILADELLWEEPDHVPFLELLQNDADPLVVEAAGAGPDDPRTLPMRPWDESPMARVREFEAALDANPDEPLEALRPVLEALDAELLERLGAVARDPELASLCEALAILAPLGSMTPVHARQCLLEALGTLPAQGDSLGVAGFRALLVACVRAAEIDDVAAFGAWSPGDLDDLSSGTALAVLNRLQELAGSLSHPTCAALSAVATHLDDLRLEVERDLPEPERSLFRLVVDAWSETIERSIEHMLAGAQP